MKDIVVTEEAGLRKEVDLRKVQCEQSSKSWPVAGDDIKFAFFLSSSFLSVLISESGNGV